jgi:hypothetical protein
MMRRYAVAILGVAALTLTMASPAAAEEMWEVPVDTIVRSKPGVVTELVVIDVPEQHQGASCDLDVIGQNQGSVHVGNDLLVESGESQVVVEGVEDTAFQTTPKSVEIVLGATITVSLVMGPDEVFSGGLTLSFDCPPPPTTTTSTTSTTQPPVSTTEGPVVLTSEVTVAPTTVAAPTTVKAVVLGQTQTAAQPQAAVLASTGSRSWELALVAMALVGVGVAVKRWAASAR